MRNLIPVMRPLLPAFDEVKKYLVQMDSSRIYSNFGPLERNFSERLADFFGVLPNRVVLCSSATVGITGLLKTSQVASFAVPGFSFPATYLAAFAANKRLEVFDVNQDSWMVEDHDLKGTSDGAGFLDVLPFGTPIRADFYQELGSREIIVDAAASIGALQGRLQSVPENVSVVISLHATKCMGVGEGGVVVLGSSDRAEQLREWTNFGFHKDRVSHQIGTNGKLSEMTAAYGLAALDRWPEEKHRWEVLGNRQKEMVGSLGLESFSSRVQEANPYWVLKLASEEQKQSLENFLHENQLQSRPWWPRAAIDIPALSDTSAFVGASQDFATSRLLATTHLGLPKFLDLSDAELDRLYSVLAAWTRSTSA